MTQLINGELQQGSWRSPEDLVIPSINKKWEWLISLVSGSQLLLQEVEREIIFPCLLSMTLRL